MAALAQHHLLKHWTPTMTIQKKLVLFSSLVTLGVASPIAFSSASGLEANDACAQNGTCCDSTDKCVVNGAVIADGWWDTTGKCERNHT